MAKKNYYVYSGHSLNEYQSKHGNKGYKIIDKADAIKNPSLLDNKCWWLIENKYFEVPTSNCPPVRWWKNITTASRTIFCVCSAIIVASAVAIPIIATSAPKSNLVEVSISTSDATATRKMENDKLIISLTCKDSTNEVKTIDKVTAGKVELKASDYEFNKETQQIVIKKDVLDKNPGSIVVTLTVGKKEEPTTTYTVTWENYDGTVLETDKNVAKGSTPHYDGEKPVKPSSTEFDYTFDGWSPDITPVVADVTYTAKFKQTKKQGDTFHIFAWNDEYVISFNRYVTDEGRALIKKGELMDYETAVSHTGLHMDGVDVVFSVYPTQENEYQNKLDLALLNNETASSKDKVDMFLAEPDYIAKYADTKYTADISTLGIKDEDLTEAYQFGIDAATDSNDAIKGLAYTICPSVAIYCRSIAKEVLGTDDPDDVQKEISDWDKFDALAAAMKSGGYYMTACHEETFRTFASQEEVQWVSEDNHLIIPDDVDAWKEQAKKYVDSGYTICSGIWDSEKSALIVEDNEQAFTCFGPKWYYDFCMGGSKVGNWGIVPGPANCNWGGIWQMPTSATDNSELVAKTLKYFLNDEDVLHGVTYNEGAFSNNKAFNKIKASDTEYGDQFLGGQNDFTVLCVAAENMTWSKQYPTYGVSMMEMYVSAYKDYFNGQSTEEAALENFKNMVTERYPHIIVD